MVIEITIDNSGWVEYDSPLHYQHLDSFALKERFNAQVLYDGIEELIQQVEDYFDAGSQNVDMKYDLLIVVSLEKDNLIIELYADFFPNKVEDMYLESLPHYPSLDLEQNFS